MKKSIKKPINDSDYVEFYANSLKENNKFFRQHKMLIDSQIIASRQIFRKKFGDGGDFNEKARDYLRKLGLLKANKRKF